MQSIELNLSNAQLGKLRRKLPVQVKPSQVGHGTSIHLGEPNFKKLVKAYNTGKSVRITLNGSEAEMSGGSLKSFARGVKKTFKDPNLGRKISNTSRKIKNSYNQFEVIGDLGIPYVSDAYNLGHVAVNSGDALTQAGVQMNNARLYGNENEKEQAKANFISEFGKAQVGMQGMRGSGMRPPHGGVSTRPPSTYRGTTARPFERVSGAGANPYVPRSMRNPVKGGSFKVSGGSFKVSGKGVRPTTDESNFVGPNHPSFNAPKPDSYSGNGMKHGRCHCCGK